VSKSAGDRAGFYDDPLIYHVLHLQGTGAEVRVFERIARRHASRAAHGPLRWLEPASGSGRYLHALAARGHRGIGIDMSAPMNTFAAAEAKKLGVGKRLEFITAPMERFELGRANVDVAFNPINSIRHLTTDKAVLAHLACVKRSLRPGGVYLVGVEVTPPGIAQPTEDVWQGRIAGLSVHQFVSYLPPEGRSRREAVISHKTVIQGRGNAKTERHIDSVYHLRTYTKEQWLRLLNASGWEIAACYGPTGRQKRFEPVGYCLQVLKPV
jgi:SAM-dependent methyltransferase